MSANKQLQDMLINRAVDLEQLKKSLVRDVNTLLADISKEIQSRLAGESLEELTQVRLESILSDIKLIVDSRLLELEQRTMPQLERIAVSESAYVVNAINSSAGGTIATVSGQQAAQAALLTPADGKFFSDWFEQLGESSTNRLFAQIRIGYVQNETIGQISTRVRNAVSIDQRNAEAVTRTLVNHAASQGRKQTFADNERLIKGIQWVSTLDTRTSAICQRRDGKIYPLDEAKYPPAHVNCRSSVVPVLKAYFEGLPPGTRASLDGSVPEDLTYGDWLRQQSAARQDEVLGPTKAKLFRAGLTIDKFSTRQGRELTLAELEQRHPDLYRKTIL